MPGYNFKEVENKWKGEWYTNNIYEAVDFSSKPKKYILAELPYPSGKSLHIGHAMRYTIPEVYSRYLRMKGYNVLLPMGWDSFGLPTEEYALKQNTAPQKVMEELGTSYKKAMQDMGYAIDWNREINTCDPNYYKWTQWLFLKFYEEGLAELKDMPVWWCSELGNLADEEIVNDENGDKVSERGGYKVERRMHRQWVLKMPEYADKLLDGLEHVDYSESIKTAQKNWIGKSDGTEIKFIVSDNELKVFTTRPDTIYGVTFLALAPEHPIIERLKEKVQNYAQVSAYIDKAKSLSDIEKQTNKDKTGIKLEGVYAKHPFDEVTREIPVFVTNYVLYGYATGSVMGVPAHDERDLEFAKKHNLEVISVIDGQNQMINSNKYNGMPHEKFFEESLKRLENEHKGSKSTTYKLRDWVFSRQRYWGEPIPVVYREDGTTEAIVDTKEADEVNKKLPLVLPETTDFKPQSDGSSPLSKIPEFVNTFDKNGKPAKRETQTMPTWAGSSWYFLRYADANNKNEFANYEKLKYWLPVDKYFGGAEHTTVHLLYSRFWMHFFYDLKIVPYSEPYKWRMNGGLMLGSDGRKMSKRWGNVVEPAQLLDKYGADATRMTLCFIGPYDDTYPWNEGAIKSISKLLLTVHDLKNKVDANKEPDADLEKSFNILVKNVTNMIENLKMNTAVSEIMIFVNEAKKHEEVSINIWKDFLKILAPFTPFLAEDLWQEINSFKNWQNENSVHVQEWPKYDENITMSNQVTIPVQINGKLRGEIVVKRNLSEKEVQKLVLVNEKVSKHLQNVKIKKFIYIKDKIVNIVV